MTAEFTQRLRQLDLQVEGLRAAIAALQRHLAGGHARAAPPDDEAAPTTLALVAEDGTEEFLRAYA